MRIDLDQPPHGTRHKSLFLLIPIIILVFLSFRSGLDNDFTNWDDSVHLLENLSVRSLAPQNIIEIFRSTVSKTYIPLTNLSWAVEYHFFGFNPFYYHFDNLLLHVANVILIFWLARQIGLSYLASSLASLLWGVHPIHTESVVWVTQRKDVLFTFFYLLGLNSYWGYLNRRKFYLYALTLVFGLLSILAKAMALSFPVALILCDYLYKRQRTTGSMLEKLPFFFYVIPITLITLKANVKIMAVHQDAGQSILIFIWSFIFYLRKFFWPRWLAPGYVLPEPVTLTNMSFLMPVFIFTLIIVFCVLFRHKRLFIFSIVFYAVSIFPILRYEYIQYLSFVADRFVYLPSAGICLYVGYLGSKMFRRLNHMNILARIPGKLLYITIFLLLSLKTYQQCDVWQNSESLWTHLINNNPRMFIPYLNRGVFYMQNKKYDKALSDFNRVIHLHPDDERAFNNRGLIYYDNKLYDLALNDFNKAIKINAGNKSAVNNRGLIYRQRQEWGAALEDFSRVIKHDPNDYIAYDNRASVYVALKEFDKALKDLHVSLAVNPDYNSALFRRGVVYGTLGQHREAVRDFSKVIELDRKDARAYNNRARSYSLLGDYPRALVDFNKSIEIDPNNGSTYLNRAVCLKALHRYQDAYADAQKAKMLGVGGGEGLIHGLENLLIRKK